MNFHYIQDDLIMYEYFSKKCYKLNIMGPMLNVCGENILCIIWFSSDQNVTYFVTKARTNKKICFEHYIKGIIESHQHNNLILQCLIFGIFIYVPQHFSICRDHHQVIHEYTWSSLYIYQEYYNLTVWFLYIFSMGYILNNMCCMFETCSVKLYICIIIQ
jgi:hypothetical protein